MRQKLKAKVNTGPHDPACPRFYRIRKDGPPLQNVLTKKKVKRSLEKALDQEAMDGK